MTCASLEVLRIGLLEQGVADEAGDPVAQWLEENTEIEIGVAH
ncbi:hypothetical protein [Ideonella sp. YS5]